MNSFEHAARYARSDCPKCRGTGKTPIDHDRFTICGMCCQHTLGRWRLGKDYAGYPGMCCSAGCGHVVRTRFEMLHRWWLDRLCDVGLYPWFGWKHACWSARNRWRYPYPGTIFAWLRGGFGSGKKKR